MLTYFALNNLVTEKDTSTYGGSLDICSMEESFFYSAFDCTCNEWQTKKHEPECWSLKEKYYTRDDFDGADFGKWKASLDFSMFDFLKPIFKKYGYQVGESKMYSPREYNFECDTVDIQLDFESGTPEGQKAEKRLLKKLNKEIRLYIDTVLVRSYDGYWSREPQTLQDVTAMDYACLWAILEKENLFDELESAFDSFNEAAQGSYHKAFDEALYTHCEANKAKGIVSDVVYAK